MIAVTIIFTAAKNQILFKIYLRLAIYNFLSWSREPKLECQNDLLPERQN